MTYPVTFIEEPAHEYEFNDARYLRIGVIDGNYVLELHDPPKTRNTSSYLRSLIRQSNSNASPTGTSAATNN